MTAGDHPLVGSWRLVRWVALADDGAESLPMGEAPEGLLVYSGDGTMVGLMGPAGRPRFASDDVTGGTDAERARAFATFIAYGGRYEFEGDTVRHEVETSLFPNWIGTVQQRRWELGEDGRLLTLTSPPLSLGGMVRVQRLTWERVRR
ncbi:MAG: lipocalin-like domain-containing protein [Chloroflexota bacterium]|nr:lipocalin-like domain-containing protein [Chloroflexota bacterium]